MVFMSNAINEMGKADETAEMLTEKDNSRFAEGDAVSYWIGSDCYAGKVIKVTPARVTVQFRNWRNETFTKRQDGRFRMKGYGFSSLSHGGETKLDPCF